MQIKLGKNLYSGHKGFTLIELLVVIAIIGVLSSTVLASLNQARERAKIAKAKVDINQVRIAMEMFLTDNGELPPIGDHCSACTNPCNGSWTDVINVLMAGGYMTNRIDTDPWGHYYCFDDNYRVPDCTFTSSVWSMGTNGSQETDFSLVPILFGGDDFGITVEPPQC